MEQFGTVEQVRKPPTSGNPADDIAFVHFAKQASAEDAMEQLKNGMELQNGCPVFGEWKVSKGGGKGGGKTTGGRSWQKEEGNDSRSIAMGRAKSRSRSGGRKWW